MTKISETLNKISGWEGTRGNCVDSLRPASLFGPHSILNKNLVSHRVTNFSASEFCHNFYYEMHDN